MNTRSENKKESKFNQMNQKERKLLKMIRIENSIFFWKKNLYSCKKFYRFVFLNSLKKL